MRPLSLCIPAKRSPAPPCLVLQGEDMKDFINPNSRKTSFAVGEPALRNVQHGTIIQLERKGFFRVDKAFVRSGQVLLFVGA